MKDGSHKSINQRCSVFTWPLGHFHPKLPRAVSKHKTFSFAWTGDPCPLSSLLPMKFVAFPSSTLIKWSQSRRLLFCTTHIFTLDEWTRGSRLPAHPRSWNTHFKRGLAARCLNSLCSRPCSIAWERFSPRYKSWAAKKCWYPAQEQGNKFIFRWVGSCLLLLYTMHFEFALQSSALPPLVFIIVWWWLVAAGRCVFFRYLVVFVCYNGKRETPAFTQVVHCDVGGLWRTHVLSHAATPRSLRVFQIVVG